MASPSTNNYKVMTDISQQSMAVSIHTIHKGYSLSYLLGPLFLTPGMVIAMHVTGQTFTPQQVTELKRFLFNKRRPEGGWGL
jgi:hypothetical protein